MGSSVVQTTILATSGSTTTATGFAIGRLGEFMLIDAAGNFLNNAIPSGFASIFLSTSGWTRIDIVFDTNSLAPTLYINGAFNSRITLSTNPVATSFILDASESTRTHFAVEGTDAYNVSNFRLWKRPLSAIEISNNYAIRNSTVALYPSLTNHKGSIMLPDGRVLFVPNNSSNAYIYTPSTNSFAIGLAATGYNGGVLLPDGRVVFVPDTATVVSLYNSYGNTLTTTALAATGYAGGVLLPNGSVLFVPSGAATVAIYTPYATTPAVTAAQALPVVSSSLASKYSGGVLLADGQVLLVPNAASCLQLYNTSTNIFDTAVSALSATGYSGGVLLSDGRVVLVPKSATTIKIFDSSSLIETSVSATGYDGGILLPDGNVMLVSNQKSELAYFNPTTSVLTIAPIGALDHLDIYATAVGCYAFRNLFKQYTGAHIRLRRAVNDEIDVWFNHMGKITKYQIVASGVSGATVVSDSITSWINSATPIYVSRWYDQSVGAKHLTQTTTTVQPRFEYDKLLGGYGVKFTGTETMTAGNLFATTTISDMQCIMRLRETVRAFNNGLSFNGTDNSNTRFIMELYSGSGWYWDPNISNRVNLPATTTVTGAITHVSAYRYSAGTIKTALTVNGISATTTANVAGTVSGGLRIGGASNYYQGFFQYLITLSAKTSDANTQAVFDILKDTTSYYNGGTLIPDGRVVLTPAGANNFGIVSGLPQVPVERCLHPCFNKF